MRDFEPFTFSCLVFCAPPRYSESFGDDWAERWQMGPAETDENGKEIKRGLTL